jgi:ABC-type multidrug transport system fused ATPase/permease subunit
LIIAFTISWEFTLIVFGGIPVIFVATVVGIKAGFAGVKEEMEAYQ